MRFKPDMRYVLLGHLHRIQLASFHDTITFGFTGKRAPFLRYPAADVSRDAQLFYPWRYLLSSPVPPQKADRRRSIRPETLAEQGCLDRHGRIFYVDDRYVAWFIRIGRAAGSSTRAARQYMGA